MSDGSDGPAVEVIQAPNLKFLTEPQDWAFTTLKLHKAGGSTRLTLPPDLLKALDLGRGDFVDIYVKKRRLPAEPRDTKIKGGFDGQFKSKEETDDC